MEALINTLADVGLILTYVLFGAALLVLLGFSIIQFISNVSRSKNSLFGIIGLVVVFFLSFLVSSGTDVSETVFSKVGTNYELSKLIGSGLISFYILFVGVVITLIGFEIYRPFKK